MGLKVYFKNKLSIISTVELEKEYTIEEFVSKIQDNGGAERVRVKKKNPMIRYHITMLFRFEEIQNKVFTEIKEDIDILLQYKTDFLESNGPSLRNSETRQGVMDQIDILNGELEVTNISFVKYYKF